MGLRHEHAPRQLQDPVREVRQAVMNFASLRLPSGADRFRLVYSCSMSRTAAVRQSVSLPAVVAKRVRAIAKTRKLSANRVLVDLIETGLQARESERERFLTLARRFKESSDPKESDRLREELANVIFGE